MAREGIGAIRLRGVDWFSWITGGANSTVILTNEIGVAEALVTDRGAWILTNSIEAPRMREEEVGTEWEIQSSPWQDSAVLDRFVAAQAHGRPVVSDRSMGTEGALPIEVVQQKRRLLETEIDRYRKLGRDSAEAMTEILQQARPSMTEIELAGEGARAMWARGIHPTLVLVAGEERLLVHRHPFPSAKKIGSRAMVVFCARRHGLYANLTRMVSFRPLSSQDRQALQDVATIEAKAWNASRPGATLDQVYAALAEAYREQGHGPEIDRHHQGGTTGYLSREFVAGPVTMVPILNRTALAWNPSLPGMKIEDTILTTESGIEILTIDPRWPTFTLDGRPRPHILERNV